MHSADQPAPQPRASSARDGSAWLSVVSPEPARAPMAPTNDQLIQWIHAVAEADRQAFAALFKHFAPRVKGFLMRAGSSAEVAEDLAQETMVALWRRAASFDPARAGASTWVFTIARHLSIDRHRRAGPGFVDDAAHDVLALCADDPEAAPDGRLLAAQREQGVRQALAALPAEQALVLRLSFFEDEPHARIAQALGIPLGTVKSRVRLAVAQLRRTLSEFRP